MKLTVAERIFLPNLLPKQGNFLTLRLVQELNKELGFSEEELKDAAIEYLPNGRIKWNPAAAESVVKDIKIGTPTKELIQGLLRDADKKNELQIEQMTLYEKFMLPGKAKDKVKNGK